jgi:hypothetical protein
MGRPDHAMCQALDHVNLTVRLVAPWQIEISSRD